MLKTATKEGKVRFGDFIQGIMQTMECNAIIAEGHWLRWSKDFSEEERARIEAQGFDRGCEIADVILRGGF